MEKTGLVMGMQREQWKTVIVVVGVTGGMYIGIKYILPLVLPFFCAFLVAYLLRPLVRNIHAHTKLNQGAVAGGGASDHLRCGRHSIVVSWECTRTAVLLLY